jgi:hypothetical protein
MEQAAFRDLFARLVESCDTWEIDLSRDLRELDRLVDFLAVHVPSAPSSVPNTSARERC